MIVGVNNLAYRRRHQNLAEANQHNGAFYYAKEIEKNIIPYVKTDRSWILANADICEDRAIVFIHDNKTTELTYGWLKSYKDLILVCGVPETMMKVKDLGRPIYLPLSIDLGYIEQFKGIRKTHRYAFAGRPSKKVGASLPYDCHTLSGMPRERLLPAMAKYSKIFAVGRTAIEAKALGCEIGVYDPRFPDPEFWRVIDNKEAAKMLQNELNKIDKEVK